MPIATTLPTFPGEAQPRDFHARMTRNDRARAVLAKRRHHLRKRYAALAVALAVPAMAGATDWGSATPNASASEGARHHFRPATTANVTLPDGTLVQPTGPAAPGSFTDTLASPGPGARVFLSAGNLVDRMRAEQCLTMAIYYEAATQPDDGQRAVAQVVLNRVAHPSFPNTVCGVVFQGSERNTGCQFTFACDGSLARKPVPYWWDRARRVALAALAGDVYAPVGLATHYHTLDVHPAWDNTMERVITIGAHAFYRFPGPAGERAAFHVAYLGGEPLAAPRPRAYMPAVDSNADPLALARAYDASFSAGTSAMQGHRAMAPGAVPPAAPLPAYSASIQARGGDALFSGGNLPAGGDLSPELQHSGQWLARQ
ncbi:MAG TPA: cell wall hydrolase [Croceibacterium sp.]